MKDSNKLFSDFPNILAKEWDEKISKDLKNEEAKKKLIWQTIEGFKLYPYYRQEDTNKILQTKPGNFPFIRGNDVEKKKWNINLDFTLDDIKIILYVIKNGVDSVGFSIYDDEELKKLKKILTEIDIEKNAVNNTRHQYSLGFLDILTDTCKRKNTDTSKVNGSIGYDPLGYYALNGSFCNIEKYLFEKLPRLIETCRKELPSIKVININGQYFNNAGSTIVQELAFSLSEAVEYLSFLTEKGFNIDEIANIFQFKFSISSDYFLEIAKLRAARYLWAKIIESYNPKYKESCKMYIHSVTSEWNKTIYDPYVNILRTTTEAMSAIIGEMDTLTIKPFDFTYKEKNEFSYRIAKNQQLILKEEAYLNKVIDPAAGSYYIETITENIIEETWKLFLEIENTGGFIKAINNGIIQSKIIKTANKRNTDIAHGKKVFVGTNKYPNKKEKAWKNLEIIRYPRIHFNHFEHQKEPLWHYRGTTRFEWLRFYIEDRRKQIKVFLLKYGNPAMKKARAEFATGFFACGGFKIIENLKTKNIESGINSAIKNKADITIVCSSDDEYPEIIPTITKKLKDKTILMVAGYPKGHITKFKKMGIYDFIHIKSNMLETLIDISKKLKTNKL